MAKIINFDLSNRKPRNKFSANCRIAYLQSLSEEELLNEIKNMSMQEVNELRQKIRDMS